MDPTTGCDATTLQRLQELGGKPFLNRMIDTYLAGARREFAKAKQATDQRDHLALSHAAHYLKSSAWNLGALRVAQVAEQIEQRAGHGFDPALPQLVLELEAALAQAEAFLTLQKREPDAPAKNKPR